MSTKNRSNKFAAKKKTKKKKKKENVDKSLQLPSIITDNQKEFYLEQINVLEPRLVRYQKRCDELELMCRAYGDQFETLIKDKRDIAMYLKKQLELRNEQVFDLNDRLIGLQQAKDRERQIFEKNLQESKQQYQSEIERLENDNTLLKTRLVALEEFKRQREAMESTIKELKELILSKEDAYKMALHSMEIALITFKDRLKKEAIEYLNDLAISFRENTKHQISNTVKRAIHENFYLTNQIERLSNQFEKCIQINQKCREEKDQLTRTVTVLEDVEVRSAKKHVASEHIIRMLCNKLEQCQEISKTPSPQEKNTIDDLINPTQIELKSEAIHRSSIVKQEDLVELEDLREENSLLKEVIDKAAACITAVIQPQNDDHDTLRIERRNDMLEQLLSILIISHRLGKSSLEFERKFHLFPGSRLGIHRIHSYPAELNKTHYCRGDLGIVPRDNVEQIRGYRSINSSGTTNNLHQN